ncbi:hypothetical protein OH710_18705 [Pseudomonas capsici]|uniref:hypothetical protein n=1 Tax=Pseudomonas capsici TaxID=2810614 RepID=UPI00190FC67F|nr:hypothetical protein [Pseudomonas capsici]MBX8610964.1 hypothetical protein [Pseudomonas cichorii]MCV4274673.1 hypothetical protein [Pseudomonas capsici]
MNGVSLNQELLCHFRCFPVSGTSDSTKQILIVGYSRQRHCLCPTQRQSGGDFFLTKKILAHKVLRYTIRQNALPPTTRLSYITTQPCGIPENIGSSLLGHHD